MITIGKLCLVPHSARVVETCITDVWACVAMLAAWEYKDADGRVVKWLDDQGDELTERRVVLHYGIGGHGYDACEHAMRKFNSFADGHVAAAKRR